MGVVMRRAWVVSQLVMLHGLVFQSTTEPYEAFIRRAVSFLLKGICV
jgi:hypothetical protein